MENTIRFQNSHTAAVSAKVRMVVGSVKEIANAIFFGNNTTKAAHIRLLDRKGFSTHKNRNLAPSAKTKPEKFFFQPPGNPRKRPYFLLTSPQVRHIPQKIRFGILPYFDLEPFEYILV
ncbi:hypothetical protein [uncultured Fibrobacter sp.]|uniref:hypothetical protein n=1 Tax=uncultured Fibrobacter sp. TaxID=261512 RepID=UPI0025CCD9C8|nr:hypothetical protein [uncultured Fibrobacter sp.]